MIALPVGRFDVIMADPPWSFKAWSAKGYGKSAQQHYDCMGPDQLAALDLASVAEKDCVLWLWATWPMLNEAQAMLVTWGFRYSTGGAWHKKTKHGKTQFGTGHRLRSACEPFLIATRGNPKTTKGVRNLIEGLVREHSRKPEEAYRACEELMPGARRLDLFGRETRPGWTTWGDQATRFDGRSPPASTEQPPDTAYRCPDTPDMFVDAT